MASSIFNSLILLCYSVVRCNYVLVLRCGCTRGLGVVEGKLRVVTIFTVFSVVAIWQRLLYFSLWIWSFHVMSLCLCMCYFNFSMLIFYNNFYHSFWFHPGIRVLSMLYGCDFIWAFRSSVVELLSEVPLYGLGQIKLRE